MRAWLVLGFVLSFLVACSSSRGPARWEPYAGCGSDQCQTWFEECRAECLNEEGSSVGTCQTQCRAKREACIEACPGR